ncbi:MAG: choice-of-anchor Q domain-containing protein, partial [Bacteroidota bacterium]
MALNLGSVAIDNPGIAASPGVDQRGLSAVGSRDIGAYEFGAIINTPPQISDFNPVSSPLLGVITINGLGFSGVTAVSFNNVFATEFTVIDDQTLIATVPNLATTGRICLSNSFGTGCSAEDIIINIPPPIVTSFDPTVGGATVEVTIVGSDLLGTTEVYFNDALASSFTASSNDTLRAIVPLNATDGPIRVVTTGGEVITTTDFTVLPGIVSFTPDRGGDNTEVIITGTNLDATTDVIFNGVSAGSITIDNSTTVRATVGVGTPLGANPIEMVVGGLNIDYQYLN